MKKFARHRTYDEIRDLCKRDGVTLRDSLYRNQGNDHVLLESGDAWVLYSTFNGQFHGETPEGVSFDSNRRDHDGEPWFQALLSFFYVEKAA